MTKFLGGVGGTKWFNFGDDPVTVRIQESEVTNPDSLEYRINYQQIFTKFLGGVVGHTIYP